MAGGVFGKTTGVAPGYELTLSWGPLELYSEGEYVFDVEDSDNDYFYNWAQLGYSPWDWLTVGLRVAANARLPDLARRPARAFVGFTCESLTLTVFVFNADAEPPTVVSSLAVSF